MNRSKTLENRCRTAFGLLNLATMRQFSASKFRRLRPIMAGVMALFTLALVLFASVERLHAAVHNSSASDHGPCAICSVAQGQVDSPASSHSVVVVPSALAWLLPSTGDVAPQSFDYSFAFSRGPPASVVSL